MTDSWRLTLPLTLHLPPLLPSFSPSLPLPLLFPRPFSSAPSPQRTSSPNSTLGRLEEARAANLSLVQAAEADRVKWREMAAKSDREDEERVELEDEVEGLRGRVERLTMHLEDAVRALER